MKNLHIRRIAGSLVCLFAGAAVLGAATLTGPVSVKASEDYWPEGPSVNSKCAVVYEVNTGTFLYEKNEHKKGYPASITKILTTMLALENTNLDDIVTFSDEAVAQSAGGSSSIYRDYGEQMTMEQCLYGVMLESANECAYEAAEYTGEKLGGDYSTFIELMNERAKELGCTDTNFTNSNGLPDKKHVTSCHDMALIAAEAYKNEDFRIITGTKTYIIPKTNKHDEVTPLSNHHKMLHTYDGDDSYVYDYCTGGKTGYTVAAGSTLVTYAEKDGIALVCVIMRSEKPNHWTDTRKLLDYCFDNYQALNISENEASIAEEEAKDTGLLNDNEKYVTLDDNAYIILPKTADFSDAELTLDNEKGKDGNLAKLSYSYAGREVGSVSIISTNAVVQGAGFLDQTKADKGMTVIKISPITIIKTVLIVFACGLVIFLIKKLIDNFYKIRHRMEMRRLKKERFKRVKREKGHSRRRRDRMFK